MSDLQTFGDAGAAFLAAEGEGSASNSTVEPEAPASEAAPVTSAEDAGATTPPEAPAAPPADEPPPAAAAEEKGPVPWGEHKKATEEAARYRTALRGFEEVFEQFGHPDDQALVREATAAAGRAVAKGDMATASEIFRQVSALFEAVQQAAPGEREAPAGGNDDEFMTRAEFLELQREQREEQEYERGVQQHLSGIVGAGRELGYVPDGTDEQREQWARTLQAAINFHDGDVRAAHAELEEEKRRVIADYLAGKGQVAAEVPAVANGLAPTPAGAEPPADIGGATSQLKDFLDTMQ